MIQTDAIRTVADAWRGSSLATFDTGAIEGVASSGQNNNTALLLIAVAFFAIVMFEQVARSVGASFIALFSPNRRDDIFGDTYFVRKSFLTTVLLLPVFAYVIYATGLSVINFWLTMTVVAALLLVRKLNFAVLGKTVTGDCIQEVQRVSDCSTVIFMTLTLPLYLVFLSVGVEGVGFCRIYLAILGAILLLPYTSLAIRKIISSGFSLFFTFLYLCALEILPLAVAVKVLID